MGEPEINAFLTHSGVQRKVAASTQNQAPAPPPLVYRHLWLREVREGDQAFVAEGVCLEVEPPRRHRITFGVP